MSVLPDKVMQGDSQIKCLLKYIIYCHLCTQ